MNALDANYWSKRYRDGAIGWDIGYASPHLIEAALTFDKEARILIPGCGQAYEAGALHDFGYTRVHVADWSREPLEAFRQQYPDFLPSHLLCEDFFALAGTYDVILEQTFFCALPPDRRDAYVTKMHELLAPGGVLTGLLFDFPLTADGPPFGGSESEYRERFGRCFEIDRLERATQSIAPRAGRELFIRLVRK